jgi:hypothetical protein
LTFSPKNTNGATCLTVKGNVIDQAACSAADSNQEFTFGGAAAGGNAGGNSATPTTGGQAETASPSPSSTPGNGVSCSAKQRRHLFSLGGIEVSRVA